MRKCEFASVVLGLTLAAALTGAACKRGEHLPPAGTEPTAQGAPVPMATSWPGVHSALSPRVLGASATASGVLAGPQAETVTPGVAATPVAPVGIRATVPWGWSLADWAISEDGAYAVLTTTGPKRLAWGRPMVVNVYRGGEDGLVEVARWAAQWQEGDFAPVAIAREEGILVPDESGTRRLAVESFSKYFQQPGPKAFLSIGGSGEVTVSQEARGARTPAAEGTLIADPLSLTSVTPSPLRGVTPEPSLIVPSGTLPPGWTVSQAVWSEDGKYLAIVAEANVNPFLDISQLSIFSLDQGGLRELWRDVSSFVTIDEELAFTDVNGDGLSEVVYRSSHAGNAWTDSGTLAAIITDGGQAVDVVFRLPIEASNPRGPVDFDGDGIFEWVAGDASWEETNCFSHADSPRSMFVLVWNGQEYMDGTYRYPEAVDRGRLEINRILGSAHLDPEPPPPEASDATAQAKDEFLSESVGRYLDYWNSGRKTDAERILQALRDYQWFGGLAAKRDWIVAALARDPHDPRGAESVLGTCPFW